ncbi:hypothetical protein IE53DRAFT_387269 [Violaceomyces palustris]|uniref:Uncharacterized protein n=1 Tax=Violaceomyces palustris TaxID=1673888 RepID=A0ACD0NXF5_9BASI|nr:hypothetical protein IE53DRAFT_387269 [Violaceomyces palustris]
MPPGSIHQRGHHPQHLNLPSQPLRPHPPSSPTDPSRAFTIPHPRPQAVRKNVAQGTPGRSASALPNLLVGP